MISQEGTHKNHGQILLIGLMVIALVTTIVGTGALRATTSTRTTKQAEEGNKASDIAKGLLEGFINDESNNTPGFSDANQDATNVGEVTNPTGERFVTSEVINKDATFMFYTTPYNVASNTLDTGYYNENLVLYFGDSEGECPILEVTQIGPLKQITSRAYIYGNGCTNPIVDKDPPYPVQAASCVDPVKCVIEGTTFEHTKTITVSNDTILLVVRPMFSDTKIGFQSPSDGIPLPLQGREISSTARTIDGAQRTEKVYQAYPQIPLNLFTTSF